MKILVANIGSTSFKYRLFDMTDGAVLARGASERIGRGGDPDYRTAIDRALGEMVGAGKALATLDEMSAVGFKAVHARGISGTQLVTEDVLQAMEAYAFLLPAHNPPYVAAMRAFRDVAPIVPAIALFETAFFDRLPESVTTYAVPFEWREAWHVRRFGFHGASHRFASERARQLCPEAAGLKHLSCHLGGSSSVAAIRGGVAVNISFGMSPQAGLPQNNRAGDLDAFAMLYVMKEHGISVDRMATILGQQSGLAGISGVGGDVRDLTVAADAGNARAKLALDVFVEAVRHYLGAFLVQMGGVDVLTFSGGIGERSDRVRRAICRGLEPFGIRLADEAPSVAVGPGGPGEVRISADDSPAQVWVVAANEEWIVARAAADWLVAQQRS